MRLSAESSPGRSGRQPRRLLWDTLAQSERTEIIETLENARRLLTSESIPPVEEIRDFEAAKQALDATWTAVTDALNGKQQAGEALASSNDLHQLVRRVHDVEDLTRRIESRQRKRAPALVRDALGALRQTESVDELVTLCPRVVSGMGFDRSLLSLVKDSVWTPHSAYVDTDPDWAHDIVEHGRQHPQRLVSSLPEFELLRRRDGILVTDAQHNTKVYQDLIGPSLSRSYVAAAIKSEGNVAGFVHCDQFFHHRDTNDFDRSVLNLFVEAFSYVYERAVLTDRVTALHSEIKQSVRRISAVTSYHPGRQRERDIQPVTRIHSASGTPSQAVPNSDPYQLTKREWQVLRIMAEGKNNGNIADYLNISSGTVKSHVKHILRKLGVTSRAEAIAFWFKTMERDRDELV